MDPVNTWAFATVQCLLTQTSWENHCLQKRYYYNNSVTIPVCEWVYLHSYQTKSYQTPPQHRSRVNLRLRDSQETVWKRRGLRQSYLPILHKYFALEILCVLGNVDQPGIKLKKIKELVRIMKKY